MFKPELLSPAGTLKNMRYAIAYGADAVYAGQPRYSLRVRNNEFNNKNLQLGINEVHSLGKKIYIAVNAMPHNAKLKTFINDLEPIVQMKPDALIMSDPGLIMLVQEHFPEINIHLSVQSNAINWATVKFWQNIGLTRVILSRELSLGEIEEIRMQVPDMEIEIFVHGALCMAHSGRCLLSGYINKRDSNQGTCTNSCRWQYNIQEGQEDSIGNIINKKELISIHNNNTKFKSDTTSIPTSKVFLMEEITRSGEYMPIFEDEHGTYIMNSKDLCAITHVERLAKIGVHSLKIEGRTKSFYYCARTAKAYRKAIDDAAEGKPFDNNLLKALEGLAHRGYTEGFLQRHNHEEYQNYEYGCSVSKLQQFVGEFTGEYRGMLASLIVKNKFSIGDKVELITPHININFVLEYMENSHGKAISVALGNGYIIWLLVPKDIKLEYALLVRYLN